MTALHRSTCAGTTPETRLQMTNYIQVFTTTATKADAQAIARAVVERRLAGCAQVIGPITSTYWWQGKVETTQE